jgi:S-adenosylmethionine:tRNA ribosyltransferase-isomerase
VTAVAGRPRFDFALAGANEAGEPPEARGLRRDGVRLLVSGGADDPFETRFALLGDVLDAGDLLVVNTSATIPAALDGRLPDGEPVVVHLSGSLPAGLSLVEVREPREGASVPRVLPDPVGVALLHGGGVELLTRLSSSARLWVAALRLPAGLRQYLGAHGRPIRYRHVARDWPLSAYQTVFAHEPGSAEMPSASRPFTHELVTDLAVRGIRIAPLVLHTGVSSLEGEEQPYPERFDIPRATATAVNDVHRDGGRVIAVGTTVVRALATVIDERGTVHPGRGWTDVIVNGASELAPIDGLLTGWHEPESTHLWMLEALAPVEVLSAAYRAALDRGFLWHEFGDSHLLLRDRGRR